jgi:putative two-component system response regulator
MATWLASTEFARDISAELCVTAAVEDDAPSIDEEIERVAKSSRILIIDDEQINIKLARKLLREAGFMSLSSVTDSREATLVMRDVLPDVVLLDLMMPHVSGLKILEEMRGSNDLRHVPVIVLTASSDREMRLASLDRGANDFLSKPVDRSELLPRVRNALMVKAHYDHLKKRTQELADLAAERTVALAKSRLEVVHCLARAAEFRDNVSGRHVYRVGRYAGIIGRELGMTDGEAELLELAAQLHDVGKIAIPDTVLAKDGKLTPEEFALMQRHCGLGKRVFETAANAQDLQEHVVLGNRMLSEVSSPLMQVASRIALTHHERWDGTGYPVGLAGEDIPIEGRITAVADVFDALSTRRPYKPAYPIGVCFEEMERGRGEHFDPRVLDAFLRRRDDVVETQIQFADVD